MEEIILASEQRIANRMDNMKIELQSSIKSIKLDITAVKSHVDNLESHVSIHDTEIQKLKDELTKTQNEKQSLENQVLLKDIHDRKPNLLFYGVKETQEENTERVLRAFMINNLNFS